MKNDEYSKIKKKEQLFKKHNITDSTNVIIENFKKIHVKAQTRFNKRKNFFMHNKIFEENAKKLYRELDTKIIK